jgi:hypothetical protein
MRRLHGCWGVSRAGGAHKQWESCLPFHERRKRCGHAKVIDTPATRPHPPRASAAQRMDVLRMALSVGLRRLRPCTAEDDAMITHEFAEAFSCEWIDAWNAHDIERVLSHYEDDFELASPFIVQIAGRPDGRLIGKAAVRGYWNEALRRMPDLQFRLRGCRIGVDSIVIEYEGVGRLAAETLVFGRDGRVVRAYANYG